MYFFLSYVLRGFTLGVLRDPFVLGGHMDTQSLLRELEYIAEQYAACKNVTPLERRTFCEVTKRHEKEAFARMDKRMADLRELLKTC